jgi:hypothetical protein
LLATTAVDALAPMAMVQAKEFLQQRCPQPMHRAAYHELRVLQVQASHRAADAGEHLGHESLYFLGELRLELFLEPFF